jgi:hypothetical protein
MIFDKPFKIAFFEKGLSRIHILVKGGRGWGRRINRRHTLANSVPSKRFERVSSPWQVFFGGCEAGEKINLRRSEKNE